MHTALRLAKDGYSVVGIDNLNTYYSVDLKLARLREQGIDTQQIAYGKMLEGNSGIQFMQLDIIDEQQLATLFRQQQFDEVIHLAAQAGVRYSIENPHAYIDSNVKGFLHVLENCTQQQVQHLIFASSSSVYGNSKQVPFRETDATDTPVSLYAATKKANEVMAHSYASVHGLPVTGLRFFTVYGPWGRPDMALFKFTEKILKGEPIDVYNNGQLSRDFTYIDDIVEGMVQLIDKRPATNPPYVLLNIGRGEPVPLEEFISAIELAIGKRAFRNNLPMQAGDVERTWASTDALHTSVAYSPKTSIKMGVQHFVDWYLNYYSSQRI